MIQPMSTHCPFNNGLAPFVQFCDPPVPDMLCFCVLCALTFSRTHVVLTDAFSLFFKNPRMKEVKSDT